MAVINAYGMKDSGGNTIKFRDDSGGGGSANSVRATYDTSPTANSYSEGDYIYYNDTLYAAITSITAGTALVVDTNIKDPDLPPDTIVSIDGLPGSGSGGGVTANDVSFDNTTSGLPATDVQTAIDEIDAEVDEITKRLSGQSNRNFVDNAWFTINQRGQSSYSANGYTVDRFRIWGNGLTLSPTTNGITVSVSNLESDRRFVSHYIDPSYIPLLSGKMVTVSLFIADGTLISKTGVIDEGAWISTSTTDEDHTVMVRCAMSGGAFFVDFGVIPGATVTIRAVKLELGSESTLAYDVAPDYSEELAKCQRFDKCITATVDNGIIGIGVCRIGVANTLYLSIPHHLRAIPTVTYSSLSDIVCIVASGSVSYATSVVIDSFNSDMLSIYITVNNTLTEGMSYPVYLMKSNDHVARLEFDAEL